MNRLCTLAVLFSFYLAPSAWADVTLRLPDSLKVVAANGENTDLSGHIPLPDGLNQLAVRLETEFGRTPDEMELAYSDVFVMTFTAADTRLSLQLPKVRDAAQLKRFNRDPDLRLTDQDGQPLKIQIARLEKEGFQLMRDYGAELSAFNQSDSPAAVGSLDTSQSVQGPAAPSLVKPGTNQAAMAEAMLKYWYQQADAATRARFKAWINN